MGDYQTMIYWINGAYGVGKSTVAEYLKKKLNKAHIFDAEEVGNAIRDNYPEESKHSVIFEVICCSDGDATF